MAYGSPASIDDVGSYYTRIRRGRRPEPAQLADLVRRYEAIGGTSSLAERTAAQIRRIEGCLAQRATSGHPGPSPEGRDEPTWVVTLGTKHAYPSIEDAVDSLLAAGAQRIVGLVLAPHYCEASVGEYHRRARAALDEATGSRPGATYRPIDHWHTLDAHVGFLASAVRECTAELPERAEVLFTAHSLPERLLAGDPYPDQLAESAAAVMSGADPSGELRWSIGWQSAGATPEPWRGPDVLEVIEEVAATGRSDGILVVPQGFTSDHLEVRYDLDIEAAAAARRLGLAFARTPVPNDDPALMDALASLVEDTVTEDTVVEDTVAEDTVAEDTVAEDTVTEDTVAEDTVGQHAVWSRTPRS